MKNLLFIVGSKSKNAFNMQLANKAERLLAGKANISYLNYDDVPFFNRDYEFPAPESVQHAREEVMKADGVWLFCPEYNHSYPGIVKNLLDWLSLPLEKGGNTSAIKGKKICISGVGDKNVTYHCRVQLTELLIHIGADLMKEPQLGAMVNDEGWKNKVLYISPDEFARLEMQAKSFLAYLGEII